MPRFGPGGGGKGGGGVLPSDVAYVDKGILDGQVFQAVTGQAFGAGEITPPLPGDVERVPILFPYSNSPGVISDGGDHWSGLYYDINTSSLYVYNIIEGTWSSLLQTDVAGQPTVAPGTQCDSVSIAGHDTAGVVTCNLSGSASVGDLFTFTPSAFIPGMNGQFLFVQPKLDFGTMPTLLLRVVDFTVYGINLTPSVSFDIVYMMGFA